MAALMLRSHLSREIDLGLFMLLIIQFIVGHTHFFFQTVLLLKELLL